MSNVDQEPETRAVAVHSLLNKEGDVVDYEEAVSIRYVDKATGQTFEFTPTGKAKTMLALFGARTLATNEASAIRNGKEFKGRPVAESSNEQMGAIRDRFALIDSGVWVDRTREAGVRWDPQLLARAFVAVAKAKSKKPVDENALYANVFEKLSNAETGSQASATLRQVDGVEAEYKKLKGTTGRDVDDVLATITG